MRELVRISEENEQIQKRLESVRPKYDHTQWERDWQANMQLIDQLSSYPADWWKNQDQVAMKCLFCLSCSLRLMRFHPSTVFMGVGAVTACTMSHCFASRLWLIGGGGG